MSKERELLEWALIFLHPNVSEEALNLHKEITELLAQPEQEGITQPKHEPLSEEATTDMFHASKQARIASCYWAGIRDAEKAHGIGGGE